MDSKTTVFTAKKIITLNPDQPQASAVAVRDGRILETGSLDDMSGWNPDEIDERFSDKIIMPGFVEAHSHSMTGQVWSHTYVGYFDRISPEGKKTGGYKSIDEIVEALRESEKQLDDPKEPLAAWGVEQIYFDDPFDKNVLDKVSETRPIIVQHCNGHVATVNSALLEQQGIDAETDVEGVEKSADGEPTGVLQEPEAQRLAGEAYKKLRPDALSEEAIRNYTNVAKNVGITTLGEVGGPSLSNSDTVNRWQRIINSDECPVRVSFAYSPELGDDGRDNHEEIAQWLTELSTESSKKLRFGIAKFFTDGSIQGKTGRLKWPGYYDGSSNGIWITPPENLKEKLAPYHKAGITIFCHCNGDEASEVFIDTIEELQNETYQSDHRHSIQHCQMATDAQYQRMSDLGICANIFSNHIYYYGDEHQSSSVGPERAKRMDACATAKRAEVPFTLHADAPVTPMSQLHTAWCAVNRRTSTGEVLGENQQIPIQDALEAVTLGAAYQLKMEDEIGSIEAGKRADFAILEDDPLTVDPSELREISVWGTVLGGQPFSSDD